MHNRQLSYKLDKERRENLKLSGELSKRPVISSSGTSDPNVRPTLSTLARDTGSRDPIEQSRSDREVESKWQFSVATPNFFTAAKLMSRKIPETQKKITEFEFTEPEFSYHDIAERQKYRPMKHGIHYLDEDSTLYYNSEIEASKTIFVNPALRKKSFSAIGECA